MPYQFTISPDFPPERLSGWYIFNTMLQKSLGESIHLELFDSFHKQKAVIEDGQIDLIFANPYDAALLVRRQGFSPLAKPIGTADEALVAVKADSDFFDVADLKPGAKIALTDDPDVRLIGMMMLEAGDLSALNTAAVSCDTYILVAKQLLNGQADAGIFLAEAYEHLSNLIQNQLRVIVKSQISVVHHSLMVGPKFAHKGQAILAMLMAMNSDDKGKKILDELGFSGWEKVETEHMEFMIDLMDALSV